jgi:hypothetical protein
MSKKPRKPPAADAARGKRKRKASNVVSFRRPGRPLRSIANPMTRIMRQTCDPDYLTALLVLVITDERKAAGLPITQPQAIDRAIAEFSLRFRCRPRRLRLTVHTDAVGQQFGKLKGKPVAFNRDKIAYLLDKGRVTRRMLAEFRRWQPYVTTLLIGRP